MVEVSVHEAKTHLSRLLRRMSEGEDIVIARGGTPVARLVPVRRPGGRQLGCDRGLLDIPEDFDAPLPDDLASDFDAS